MSSLHTNATCQNDWRERGCCLTVLQPEENALHQVLAFLSSFSKRFEYQGRSCARFVGGEPTRWMLSWWTKKSTINPVSAVNTAEINWGEWKSIGNCISSSVADLKGFCFILAVWEIMSLFMDVSTVFLTTNNCTSPKAALKMDLDRTPPQEVLHLSPQMRNPCIDVP